MKNGLVASVFVLLASGTVTVGANLRGSDTLDDVVKFMTNPAGSPFCVGTTGLIFLGVGSNLGEQAMTGTGSAPLNTPSQSVAPMIRPLSAGNVCTTKQGTPATAAGTVIGLDSVAMVAADNVTNLSGEFPDLGCKLKYTSGNATDWRDVLRMIYAGANPSPDNAGAGSAASCDSAARRALVDDWASLFNGGCTGAVACTQLRHAFRRSDLDASTEMFLSLLGLPPSGNSPFCNGVGATTPLTLTNSADFADRDPIRRPCAGRGDLAGSEQVCDNPEPGPNQNTLGLVLPIFVSPLTSTTTAADLYPTAFCSPGFFEWRDNPAAVPTCPYGVPTQVGACLLPLQNTASGPNFACINRSTNRGFFLEATGADGRIYNLIARRADGTIVRDVNNRRLLGSYYRLHTNRVLANGFGGGCQQASSNNQIGCLVAANPCSIGYITRIGLSQPGTAPLLVRGRRPTVGDIQTVVAQPLEAYPFARKLYFNSVVNPDIVGLGTAGTLSFRQQQAALKTCFTNAATTRTAIEASGFVEPLGGPFCEDFDEQAGCGAATNINACP